MNRTSILQQELSKSMKMLNGSAKDRLSKSSANVSRKTLSKGSKNNDISDASSMNLRSQAQNRSQLQNDNGSKQEKGSQSKGSGNQSENEFFKNENEKSKKLKFLNERQKHVLVGMVGAAIIILLSYALLTVLALIKQ